MNGCLIYVWRVPEDSNAIANFASSPTRQNGFSAPTPPAMLWEPTFDETVPLGSSVDADGTESTATLMAAIDDAMPVVLILVRSVPWQLQKIEWAVARLNADGKVELHGLQAIWEPELDAGDPTSDVEAFDSGMSIRQYERR